VRGRVLSYRGRRKSEGSIDPQQHLGRKERIDISYGEKKE